MKMLLQYIRVLLQPMVALVLMVTENKALIQTDRQMLVENLYSLRGRTCLFLPVPHIIDHEFCTKSMAFKTIIDVCSAELVSTIAFTIFL